LKLIDVLNNTWAIIPEKLNSILHVADSHNQGDKLDLKAIEKAIFDFEMVENQEPQTENNNIAVININGMLMKRPSILERILFDAVSMEKIRNDIEKALVDDSIDTVLLFIDSPGGTVDGTKDLADFIYSSRDKKKIIAFSDGVMASAAYWIASSAHEIYISNDTVNVGSIGVITSHVDVSAYNENLGVKVTDIYSGEYKAAGSENKPLDEKSSAYLQDRVDYIYSVFINDISRSRKQSTAFVVDRMANGRVFIGGSAFKNKMVDGVSTYENLIKELSNMKNIDEYRASEFYGQVKTDIEKVMSDKFEAQAKDIELKAIESERKRISDIQSLSIPGFEKVVEEGIKTGLLASDVSIKMIHAQKELLAEKATALETDVPAVVPEVEPVEEDTVEKDFMEEAKAKAKAENISFTDARKAVILEQPKTYEKYRRGAK